MTHAYKLVRALDRGLVLLTELNRRGRAAPAELSETTGIDRTTVYRLLHTLARRGLVGRSSSDDSYYLLRGVRNLSDGYVETDKVLHVAAAALGKLLVKVQWPSDFAAFDRGEMVIQETTHRFSAFSVHRNMVGRRRSLLHSALGRSVLVGAPPEQRDLMLTIAGTIGETVPQRQIDALLADYEARGYTWSAGETESHISAIALPILARRRVMGAINIVFFRSALTPEQMAERHLADLRHCRETIEREIGDIPENPD